MSSFLIHKISIDITHIEKKKTVLAQINCLLSSVLVMSSCLFACQLIFEWITDNVTLALLGAGYFCNIFIFSQFYLFILLYNIVLVLPYTDMNLPWVYLCSPSWTPLPPPSPSHPSGSSQCKETKLRRLQSLL